jgi:hypothetical protein
MVDLPSQRSRSGSRTDSIATTRSSRHNFRPGSSLSHQSFVSSYRAPSNRSHGDPPVTSGSKWTNSVHTTRSETSLNPRSGTAMAGIMDVDRSRTRRERTFVGSECAVCEEPLEHTLRGERVLQFSCGHVSHEACFYEYIKEFESQYCPTCNAPLGLDTSRGGNVLDLGEYTGLVPIGGHITDLGHRETE